MKRHLIKEHTSACDDLFFFYRCTSSLPMQLAGVPDQMPSAWHSLMLVPWRSKSGLHRTPQAASKWLLHTFWMKKPFSGGDKAGQYTTGKRGKKKREEKKNVKSWLSYWSSLKKTKTDTQCNTHTKKACCWKTHWLWESVEVDVSDKEDKKAWEQKITGCQTSSRQSTQREEEKAQRGPWNWWLMNIIVLAWTVVWKSLAHLSRNGWAAEITGRRIIRLNALILISHFCGILCFCSSWFIVINTTFTTLTQYPVCLLATNSPTFFTLRDVFVHLLISLCNFPFFFFFYIITNS